MKRLIFVILAFFTSLNSFGYWADSSFTGSFLNNNVNQNLESLDILSFPHARTFNVHIGVRFPNQFEELKTLLTHENFDVGSDALIRILFVTIPIEHPERVKALIETLNAYEPIQPSEIVEDMKRKVDSELQSFHLNRALAERNRPPRDGRIDGRINDVRARRNGVVLGLMSFNLLRHFRTLARDIVDTEQQEMELLWNAHVESRIPQRNEIDMPPHYYKRLSSTDIDSEDESMCPLCLTKITEVMSSDPTEGAVRIGCAGKHMFCKTCIEEEYHYRQICPTCRSAIGPET